MVAFADAQYDEKEVLMENGSVDEAFGQFVVPVAVIHPLSP
ncbi:MAG: hypothetical protein BMS9Abin02_2113 [Anaerolineae bacterium]|nr:MAG: hypothetical protein BMS9Abin02_2113 [Anaerolineae bacterium]